MRPVQRGSHQVRRNISTVGTNERRHIRLALKDPVVLRVAQETTSPLEDTCHPLPLWLTSEKPAESNHSRVLVQDCFHSHSEGCLR